MASPFRPFITPIHQWVLLGDPSLQMGGYP